MATEVGILTDEIVQASIEEIWEEIELLYMVAYPEKLNEDRLTDVMNDFSRTFTPDFINTLFLSSMGVLSRKMNGDVEEDGIYFDLRREDVPNGQNYVKNVCGKDIHYVCLAPIVFRSLFMYRPLFDTLQNKHLLLTGMKSEPNYILKRVYRGLLFSIEKAYDVWNKQGITEFLGE